MRKHVPHRRFERKLTADAVDDLNRFEAMPTEHKEMVVAADAGELQDVLPNTCKLRFELAFWREKAPRILVSWLRQGALVDLAARRQR